MEEVPDDLITRLVDEVALTGSFGFDEDALKKTVASFYHERNQESRQLQDEQPSETANGDFDTLDHNLLAAILERLEQHRDIHVKTEDDGIVLADANGEDPTRTARHAGCILIASKDRMLRTLSHARGKKVEQMGSLVFDCLSVIGAYGPAGILQNDLRRVTGQQKQSVPLRTDRLAQKGYITKRAVLASGAKTSMLKLKRWADTNDRAEAKQTSGTSSARQSNKTIIDYDMWLDDVMRLINAQPNRLIAIQDLRIGLGIHGNKFHQRALMRCIRRLSHAGVLRKISAKPADQEGIGDGKAIRCVQLMRDPTDLDRGEWKRRTVKGKRYSKYGIIDQSSGEDEAGGSDDSNSDDGQRTGITPDVLVDETVEQETVKEPEPPGTGVLDYAIAGDEVGTGEHRLPGRRESAGPRPLDSEPPHVVSEPDHTDSEPHEPHHDSITSGLQSHSPVGKRKRAPTRRYIDDVSLLASEALDAGTGSDDEGDTRNGAVRHTDFIDELQEAAVQPRQKRKYTKRQHNGPKLPIIRTKPRITSEKSNPKFEAWARRTAEKLVKIQAWAEKEAAELQKSQQQDQQESHLPEVQAEDAQRAEEEAQNLEQRTAQLEEELLARSRQGVYINPPGALDLKASTVYQRGRPRNACIAVIKSDRLGQLNLVNSAQVGAILTERDTQDAGLDESAFTGSPPQAHSPSPNVAQNDVQDVAQDVTQDVAQNVAQDIAQDVVQDDRTYKKDYVASYPNEQFYHVGNGRWRRGSRTKDLGRKPSMSQKSAVELAKVGDARLPMAPPPITPEGSRPQRAKVLPVRYSEDVLVLETPEDFMTPVSIASTELGGLKDRTTTLPAVSLDTSASTTTRTSLSALARFSPVAALAELRLKRGRPSKAVIAEKERLQNEIAALSQAERQRQEMEVASLPKARPSVIAKLSIPALRGTSMTELLRQASAKRSSQKMLTPQPGSTSSPLLSNLRSDLSVQKGTPGDAKQQLNLPATSPLTIVRPYHTPTRNYQAPLARAEGVASSSGVVPDAATSPRADEDGSAEETDEDPMNVGFPEPLDDDRAAHGDSDFEPDADDPDGVASETEMSEPEASEHFMFPRKTVKNKYGSTEKHRLSNDDNKRRLRASIILDLLERCGGVFPGNGEIFFPFCREWRKTYDVVPDRRTLNAAIQRLVEERKVKRVVFSFPGDHGSTQERSLLTFASVESTSVLIEEAKEAIITAYPSRYVPEEVGGQQVEEEGRKAEAEWRGRGVSERGIDKEEFPVMEGLAVQRTHQALEMADAAAQADGFSDARSRKRHNARAAAKRHYAKNKKHKLVGEANQGSATLDTHDEPMARPRKKARTSGLASAKSKDAVPGASSRGRRGLFGDMRFAAIDDNRTETTLLVSTSQRFYPTSGTFSTDTSVSASSWPRMQSLPQSLDEIVQRAELLGHYRRIDTMSGIDRFNAIVDRVSAWEADLRNGQVVLTNDAAWQFVNFTMFETHITMTQEPSAPKITLDKLVEYDLPDDFVTKEHTLAHPEEQFHHVGAGRYRRGAPPPDYVRGKPSKTGLKKPAPNPAFVGIPCYRKEYVDAHPDEEFYHMAGGLYRRGPRPAHYKGRGNIHLTAAPKEEYFSKEYKDAHPNEDFWHIGGGRYRRGKMPDGFRDPRKSGASARYDRERSKNHGRTYHESRKSNDGQDSRRRVDQSYEFDAHSVEESPYSRVGTGDNADADAVTGADHAGNHTTSRRISTAAEIKYKGKLKFKQGSETYDKEYKDTHPEIQLIHVGAGRWRKVDDVDETASTAEPTSQTPSTAVVGTGQVDNTPLTAIPWHALPAPSGADDRSTRKYRSRKKRNANELDFADIPLEADGDFEPDAEPDDEARPTKRARVSHDSAAPKRRAGGRPRVKDFPDAEDLLMSVALIRVLCGGLYQTSIKWELVAHAMSFKYEAQYLLARWASVRQGNHERVERLQEAIHGPFLEAYERGELPTIDFQHAELTDWPAILEWAKRLNPQCSTSDKVEAEMVEKQIVELPQSLDGLQDDFTISDHVTATEADLEQHFRAPSGEQRGVLALRYIEGVPLVGSPKVQLQGIPQLEVLQSWCRAVSVAKVENYNSQTAFRKISAAFSEAMIQRAVDELQTDSILTLEKGGHQLPGRNFRLHHATLKQFRRWPDEEYQYLRDVAAARERIIAHFDAHETLELSMHTNDPDICVLTNMVFQGHLKVTSVLPEQNNDIDAPGPRLSIWGIDSIHTLYDSKNVNPARIRFPLVYRWTPKFRHQHELQQYPVPTVATLADNKQDPRIPLWVDIHGNFVDEVWDTVMRSVLHLLVFRPGSTVETIEKAHDGKLWTFEIKMLLSWMEQTGLALRFGDGQEVDGAWTGGWRASEWWYCACAADFATWQAPSSELK